jgi:hypothetical protein
VGAFTTLDYGIGGNGDLSSEIPRNLNQEQTDTTRTEHRHPVPRSNVRGGRDVQCHGQRFDLARSAQ